MKHLIIASAVAVVILLSGCYIPTTADKALVASPSARGPYFLDTTLTIEVRNAGPEINTLGNDYAPFVYHNGKIIYFTSQRGNTLQDLYVGFKDFPFDTAFHEVKILTISSNLNEGSLNTSANDSMVVFVGCNRPGGVGDCDLYRLIDGYSAEPKVKNIYDVNSGFWDAAPALSSDGKTLYFVSNRLGAMGGIDDADIYVSQLQSDGIWSSPKNLGPPINTTRRQDSPFMAFGDSLLFFSSDAPGGYGGLDLYVSHRQPDGSWGKPMNLGKPINSPADERYFSSTSDGATFYFCSTRKDIRNYGDYDIYMVQFVESP